MIFSRFALSTAPQHRTQCSTRSRHFGQRATALSLLAVASLSMTGCARAVTETSLSPDGSWTRKITFHGVKPDPNGFTMGQTIDDAVTLPKGPEWKTTRKEEKDEQVITVERTLPAGSKIDTIHGDITIKGGKKQVGPLVVNDLTVRQIQPGVWRYTETFHWKGDMPKDLTPDPETVAAIKKALPPTLATDANAKDLGIKFTNEFVLAMLGPNNPLVNELAGLMAQPELMERRIMTRMSSSLDTLLKAKFGNQLTPEKRSALIHDVIGATLHVVNNKSKPNGPGGAPNIPGAGGNADENSGAMVSLFLSVKLPGRITETNGEQDPIRHDVYWAFYPEAAALGDVKLTATCDTNK